ncbi:Hsp70 family protein [Sphaerimonospora cavernae]|uniref:Hsp70 family protein n=1 Tax=Sphaerimonospora cavernae TaxID=1740611 RepID=A0ABV6UBE3_9ACTN
MATGIDFGTTNSVVAQWNGDEAEVLQLDTDNIDSDWLYEEFQGIFPTIVGESSTRLGALFGWEAKLRSNRVFEACKRMLRNDESIRLRDASVPASVAAAGVFRAMRERAEHNLLRSFDSAVITVPANARGAARYRTRTAAQAAGIQVKALLNEPTAAALSYMYDMQEEGRIMVFDWGGGTIDVTILEHIDGHFEELASKGITQLGGIELDKRLRKLLLRKLPGHPVLSELESRELDLIVERTKIRLSRETSAVARFPGNGKLVQVTRDEFEREIADLVEQALQPARQCLNELGMHPDEIDGVLMIGGTSQLPSVRNAVERLMDDEVVPSAICHPMTAVARGAAIAAAILDGKIDSYLRVSSMFALGTATTNQHTGEKVFSAIIDQHTPLPAIEEKKYTPIDDGRVQLTVPVWEADPAKSLDDPENFQLTKLVLKYPRRLPREKAIFNLRYTYTVDGLLHVKGTLDETGEVLLDEEIRDFTSGDTLPVEEIRRRMSALDRLTPSGASLPQLTPAAAKSFVVDGSNLAWHGRDRRKGDIPSLDQLLSGVQALHTKFPGADVTVFVDATLRHQLPPGEQKVLDDAIRQKIVHTTPAGTHGKGDRMVVMFADETGSVIVTNDSYQELQAEFPFLLDKDRVLGATPAGNHWLFPPRTPVRPRSSS